jgi:hypothetical protein
MLPDWFEYKANCHVQGRTQMGKSSFKFHCFEECLYASSPFCSLEGKTSDFNQALALLAYFRPHNPVYLIDLTNSRSVTPIDFFGMPPEADPSAHASTLTRWLVNIWGERNTNQTPVMEKALKALFTVQAYTGEPLHHIIHLLRHEYQGLRSWAIEQIPDGEAKWHLRRLQYLSTLPRQDQWHAETYPAETRLSRLVGSRAIKLLTGLPPVTSIRQWINEQAIVLVNCQPSTHFDEEAAETFSALLIKAFFNAAMENVDDPQPYFLFFDEAQRILRPDMADMLDMTLASGLRCTIAHHHLNQQPFLDSPHLRASLDGNTGIKVIFNGLPFDECERYAQEFWPHESVQRHKKEDQYAWVPYDDKEYFETATDVEGHLPTGDSKSHSVSGGWRNVTRHEKELIGQTDYSRPEVIAQYASRFCLPPRHCIVKLPDKTYEWEIPEVTNYAHLLNPQTVLDFKNTHSHIPIHAAIKEIQEAEARFLEKGASYATSRPAVRRAKQPTKTRPLFSN